MSRRLAEFSAFAACTLCLLLLVAGCGRQQEPTDTGADGTVTTDTGANGTVTTDGGNGTGSAPDSAVATTHPDWPGERVSPFASPYATVGGEMVLYAGPFPKSFNYYLETSTVSRKIFSGLFESLLSNDPETLEETPNLASKWEISDDKMTFTFWIDERARWSDGQPVTAADVVFTYDTIMDDKNLTGPHKVDVGRLERPEIVDERTVRFRAKSLHWGNLLACGFMDVLPKHHFEGKDFNEEHFDFPVVSGPYRIGDQERGVQVVLERRPDWWRRGAPASQLVGNFERLRYRFFTEADNAWDDFRKGKLDMFSIHKAATWVNETTGERFEKNWIVKQKVRNLNPVGFQGFAMNLRRDQFKDLRVRQALAHLLDRPRMNETIMFNQYFLQKSYYEDLYDAQHPCRNPEFHFDKEKARALLAEAGWTVDEQGKLVKDGQPFVINFLTRSATSDKFLAIYKEDLADVGIELHIERKDWAAWMKDMDEFNFDMTWAAWSSSVFKDPEYMWHSDQATQKGGNNTTGFISAEVDRLIEQQRGEFDLQKRNEIVRRIDAIVAENVPYILLWNIDYVRLTYWQKFGTPPTVLGKYGDADAAPGMWWADPDLEADLEAAREAGEALPPKPFEVDFEKIYQPTTKPEMVP